MSRFLAALIRALVLTLPALQPALAVPPTITPSPTPPDKTSIATLCGKLTVGDVTKRAPTACDDSTKGYSVGTILQLQARGGAGSGVTDGVLTVAAPASVAGTTTATATLTTSGGAVSAAVPAVTGTGYAKASGTVVVHVAAPTLGGTAAVVHGVLDGAGGVGSYVIDSGGSGYGALAPGSAVAQSNGNIAAVGRPIIAAASVSNYAVDDGGKGYTTATTITATYTGTGPSVTPGEYISPPTSWYFNGILYNPVDLTPGAAVWIPVNGGAAQGSSAIVFPVDASGVTAASNCYGTIKQYSQWAGDSFILTRASDSTTLSIGFIGSYADGAKADNFCAGTTCVISTLKDQCGGADATMASVATAPIWPGNPLGASRAITFDSQIAGLPTVVSKFLTVAGGSFNPAAMSISILGRVRGAMNGLAFTTNAGASQFIWGTASQPGMRSQNTFSLVSVPTAPNVLQFISNAALDAVFATTDYIGSGHVSATPPVGPFVGATISFSAAAGAAGAMDLSAIIIHNSVLTPAQQQAEKNALILESQITPQGRDILLITGDSIANGTSTSGNRGWATQIQTPLADMRHYNMGQPGQLFSFDLSQFATFYPRMYDGTVPNYVALIEDGVNDFLGNATAATVETTLASFVALLRAQGANTRIVLMTVVEPCAVASASIAACPRATSAQLIQIQTYNTWLRANWPSLADALADVDASPVVGGVGGMFQPSNTLDGLHLNNQGGSAWVPIIVSAIQSVRR